jgi:parallel beta-helix repeat protein
MDFLTKGLSAREEGFTMSRTTVILFGFALGLLSTQGKATTYYLDSGSGNDFHSGAQVSSSWKTFRYASSRVYHPGDQILLKAGSVWTGETLDVTTSDESGDPITIGSYGTGKQPIIDGANSSSNTPITLRNAHNVTINGLTIQNAGSSLITVRGGSNNTVTNCTLLNASIFPVQVRDSPGFTFANNTYASTGSFKTIAAAFLAFGSPSSGLTVTGNTITLNAASNGAEGIYVVDTNNAVVSGNTITGGSQAIGIKAYHGSVIGAQLHDNAIYYTDRTAGDGESIEFTGKQGTSYRVSGSIDHNFIQGGPNTKNAIGGFLATNTAVYNNIVMGPLQNAAIHWSSSSTGASFYGNTIHSVRVAMAIRYINNTATPGPGIEGARWLSSRQVFAVGSDTVVFEKTPNPAMPVHAHLLVESGIHIIEVVNLEELARESVHEFVFVAAPMNIRGATGAPLRPLAFRLPIEKSPAQT